MTTTSAPLREPLEMVVTLKYASAEEFEQGYAACVGSEAVFLRTRASKPIGTFVRLVLRLKDGTAALAIEGHVLWSAGPERLSQHRVAGMGIQARPVDDASAQCIERIVRNLGEGELARAPGTLALDLLKKSFPDAYRAIHSASESGGVDNLHRDLDDAFEALVGSDPAAGATPPEVAAGNAQSHGLLTQTLREFGRTSSTTPPINPPREPDAPWALHSENRPPISTEDSFPPMRALSSGSLREEAEPRWRAIVAAPDLPKPPPRRTSSIVGLPPVSAALRTSPTPQPIPVVRPATPQPAPVPRAAQTPPPAPVVAAPASHPAPFPTPTSFSAVAEPPPSASEPEELFEEELEEIEAEEIAPAPMSEGMQALLDDDEADTNISPRAPIEVPAEAQAALPAVEEPPAEARPMALADAIEAAAAASPAFADAAPAIAPIPVAEEAPAALPTPPAAVEELPAAPALPPAPVEPAPLEPPAATPAAVETVALPEPAPLEPPAATPAAVETVALPEPAPLEPPAATPAGVETVALPEPAPLEPPAATPAAVETVALPEPAPLPAPVEPPAFVPPRPPPRRREPPTRGTVPMPPEAPPPPSERILIGHQFTLGFDAKLGEPAQLSLELVHWPAGIRTRRELPDPVPMDEAGFVRVAGGLKEPTAGLSFSLTAGPPPLKKPAAAPPADEESAFAPAALPLPLPPADVPTELRDEETATFARAAPPVPPAADDADVPTFARVITQPGTAPPAAPIEEAALFAGSVITEPGTTRPAIPQPMARPVIEDEDAFAPPTRPSIPAAADDGESAFAEEGSGRTDVNRVQQALDEPAPPDADPSGEVTVVTHMPPEVAPAAPENESTFADASAPVALSLGVGIALPGGRLKLIFEAGAPIPTRWARKVAGARTSGVLDLEIYEGASDRLADASFVGRVAVKPAEGSADVLWDVEMNLDADALLHVRAVAVGQDARAERTFVVQDTTPNGRAILSRPGEARRPLGR